MAKHQRDENRRALPKPIVLAREEVQQVAAGLLSPNCGGSGPFIPWGPDPRPRCPIPIGPIGSNPHVTF
jgi:hypothetical protein